MDKSLKNILIGTGFGVTLFFLLMNLSKVEELFDYCQILEAYITRPGWEFLIQVHGYEGLYKINKRSGWFPEEESLEEFQLTIQGEMEQTVWQDEA